MYREFQLQIYRWYDGGQLFNMHLFKKNFFFFAYFKMYLLKGRETEIFSSASSFPTACSSQDCARLQLAAWTPLLVSHEAGPKPLSIPGALSESSNRSRGALLGTLPVPLGWDVSTAVPLCHAPNLIFLQTVLYLSSNRLELGVVSLHCFLEFCVVSTDRFHKFWPISSFISF